MKFLDTNVIVHAFLKPKRILGTAEKQLKAKAQKLVQKIEIGEQVITTVVNIAEITNIFSSIDKKYAYELISRLLNKENIIILSIDRDMYLLALEYARDYVIDIHDCLAVIAMQRQNCTVIYSFDHDFDKIPEIQRCEE